MTRQMAPVPAPERYEFLDVLRGVALFGIITANTYLYSLYGYLSETAKAALPIVGSDGVMYFLEVWLIESKFYTLFSLLFGVGFAILLTRAKEKGLVFHRFFLRRAFFLFLIGAVHAVLVWHVDILGTYALCGMLLLPFTAARPRTIVAVAIACLLVPIVLIPLGGVPVGWLLDVRLSLFERFGFTLDTRFLIFAQGSVADIVRLNLASWFGNVSFLISSGMVFKVYGCFLLGFLFGRLGLHQQLPQHRALIRRIAVWGVGVGLPLNFIYATVFETDTALEVVVTCLSVLPLSVGYAAVLCLVWLAPEGPRRLRHFASVGRMALTNYIGQSVICTLIFYNTGFGLGGTVGPTIYLLVGVPVYAFQVIASNWWLARFRFGPLEWLWRMATYGQRIPLAKASAPPATAA